MNQAVDTLNTLAAILAVGGGWVMWTADEWHEALAGLGLIALAVVCLIAVAWVH
jgi:hypothetical protein